MSKAPKVEIVAEQAEQKSIFENTPKLFSKWEYESINVQCALNVDH